MSVISRGIRNAFRNTVRTTSIVAILGLSLGLSLAMLVAHQAVNKKINDLKASVGNTVTISPAGYNPLSQANNSLTTTLLAPLKSTAHITSLTETLTDRLTTIGTSSAPKGAFTQSSGSNSNAQTSLKSPVTLNSNGNGGFSGGNGRAGVFINGGGGSLPTNFSLPISILGTNDPTILNSQTGNTVTITSGTIIDGSKDTNDAMVSTDMATKNNLKVGSTFTAYGKTLTVAAIYSSDTQGGNDTVIVSLPALQRLSGQGSNVTAATATVDSLDNLASATSAIKTQLGSTADVENSQTEADNAVQPLQNIQKISLYSLIGAGVAGAVIIFMTMLMIVRERRREIGVIKAIGASNLKVVWQFMTEAITLTLLAAVVGIIIGVAAASPITNTLVSNATNSSTPSTDQGGAGPVTISSGGSGAVSRGFVANGRGLGAVKSNLTNIHAAVGWSIILYGLASALIIAIIGSSVASWFIAKVRPAEVMRVE